MDTAGSRGGPLCSLRAQGMAALDRAIGGGVSVTTRQRAPMRDVIRIIEVVGARGGVVLVHMLGCDHWVTRRVAAKRVPCIGCVVEQRMAIDRRARSGA